MIRFKANGREFGDHGVAYANIRTIFRHFTDLFGTLVDSAWFELYLPIARPELSGPKAGLGKIEGYFDCYLFSVHDICKVRSEVERGFVFHSMSCIDSASHDTSCVRAAAVAYKYLHQTQMSMPETDFHEHLHRDFVNNILNSLGYQDQEQQQLLQNWADRIEEDLAGIDLRRISRSPKFGSGASIGTVNPEESFVTAAAEACKHLHYVRKNTALPVYDKTYFEQFLLHDNFFHYVFNSLGNDKVEEWQFLESCLNKL